MSKPTETLMGKRVLVEVRLPCEVLATVVYDGENGIAYRIDPGTARLVPETQEAVDAHRSSAEHYAHKTFEGAVKWLGRAHLRVGDNVRVAE